MNNLWSRIQPSVLSLTFENADGRMSSGTGFKVGKFLITNNHVIQIPNAKTIVLRSVLADGHSTGINLRFGHLTFRTMMIDGDPEDAWDYAIIRIDDPNFLALPSLELEPCDEVAIGASVALFGYQFEQPHLSMHVGYVSSQYPMAGVQYIQLDSSVNNGNSGGPLIDVSTGRVIGLVTRKATGLTKQFDELSKAFRLNIDQLQAVQKEFGMGAAIVGGMDPVASTLAIQVQLERISKEIGRSANVGIGYAYHIRKVRDSLSLLTQE